MAETLALYKCVLFLLALQILLTEGRPIKSMNTLLHQSKSANNVQESPMSLWFSVTAVRAEKSRIRAPVVVKFTKKYNVQESTAASNDDFQSGTMSGQKEAVPVTSSSVDDFRPTSPGFSPGVGHPKQIVTSSSVEHSITGVKAVGPTKPVAVGHSSTEIGRTTNLHQSKSTDSSTTASATDDFRPTSPGYSPGVGHPKKPAAITSSNVFEHSVTGVKAVHSSTEIGRTTNLHQSKSTDSSTTASATDDFRPTSPGYSPGVGHPKKPAVVTISNVVEHSVAGFKDDYRPTQPGHSPGVGHKNSVDPEPNP